MGAVLVVFLSTAWAIALFGKPLKKGTPAPSRASLVFRLVAFSIIAVLLTVVLITALITHGVRKMAGPFDTFRFITANTLYRNGGGGSQIKVIMSSTTLSQADLRATCPLVNKKWPFTLK